MVNPPNELAQSSHPAHAESSQEGAWGGVYTAVVTPFTSQGLVNEKWLYEHSLALLDCKHDGIVVGGSTGESVALTQEEHALCIQTVLAACKAKSAQLKRRCIANCGYPSTQLTFQAIEQAAHCGADGALIVTPYYNRPTLEGIRSHYFSLADRSPLPLLIYHVPSRTRTTLPPGELATLLEHPRIIGIKEASPDFSHWQELLGFPIVQKKTVLCGDDAAMSTQMALGAKGIISAASNVLPQAFKKIYDDMVKYQWPSAFRTQRSIQKLIQLLFQETNPGPVKWLLHYMSRLENHSHLLRLPLVPPSSQLQAQLSTEFNRLRNEGVTLWN